MPELPDIETYLSALKTRVLGVTARDVAILSPYLLRTVEPAVEEVVGRAVLSVRRLGKRIVFEFEDELFVVMHLMTAVLTDEEVERLWTACRQTLSHWTSHLCRQFVERFPGPGNITAFREGFAVHGRFGKPCPVCATAVQRIRYAEHETNYCPRCQTGGRLLADRSLSRLLKRDWPRSVEAQERHQG